MRRNFLGAFLALVFISACTKQSSPNREAAKVDPQAVKSVMLVGSQADAAACADSIEKKDGKVLFQSDTGLMFSDLPAGALNSECKATASDNEPIRLEEKTPQKKEDLSTILRLIPAEEIGARTFIKNNPEADGRGVVVAVLDTGVELDHPMLTATPNGQPKIINANDFSGEGRLSTAAVTVSADGVIETELGAHSVKDIAGADFQFGVFKGSTLKYSEDVAALDDYKDAGVITYTADGKRFVRIDTNSDKNFTDEIALLNFGEARGFTKFGAKKLLTTAVNVSEDGKEIVLHFDDGSHGTHVAGIATGYNPDGLQGVAPGAQVISAKIGDSRLSGGSTTTASMLLAIDWAVKQKADVINLSYGIRSGSNIGKSVIDQYIDKVAAESGVLFSISAGNEGPGLLTIGTPAAADLAITNGAYISAATARDNYGYIGMEDNTIWYFSSVGPRLDGGLKPTLLSPGSALSSVPVWSPSKHLNYRGTSMASPQTTGGLALILSAARQRGLLADRPSVTRAVYDSAVTVSGLDLIEQGHGLMNVPAAVEKLAAMKTSPIEYTISVNNPVSPTGRGGGIFVRDPAASDNLFTVTVAPLKVKDSGLRTFRLVNNAKWIKTPGTLWMEGPNSKTFQVTLDYAALDRSGVHSELLKGLDDRTGEIAFEVPVTVILPKALSAANQYKYESTETVRVGQTKRHFIQVPPGTTALTVELSSDGPTAWTQLLDPEGRKLAELIDAETTSPMPTLYGQASVSRGGFYELDVVLPGTVRRPAKITLKVQAYSLNVSTATPNQPGLFDVTVENQFAPVKIIPKVEITGRSKEHLVSIAGNSGNLPFEVSKEEKEALSEIQFLIETSKKLYDQMTDYPFRVFDEKGGLVTQGGLEMKTPVHIAGLSALEETKFNLEIQGAFTKAPPKLWTVKVTESRVLRDAVSVMQGGRLLIETGQFRDFSVDLRQVKIGEENGLKPVTTLKLESVEGRLIQSTDLP